MKLQFNSKKFPLLNLYEKLIYPPIVLGSLEDRQMDKIREAQNYIKKAPNLPIGYIDLGIAYAESGKRQKSIQALTKALELSTTPNDQFIAYFNMAVVEMNIGDLSKAMEYAQQAQQISNTEEVSDLISNISHAVNTKKKPFDDNYISN